MSERSSFVVELVADDASDCPSEDEEDAVEGLVILGDDTGPESLEEDEAVGAVGEVIEGGGSVLEEAEGSEMRSDEAVATTEQSDVFELENANDKAADVSPKRTKSPWSVAHEAFVGDEVILISLDMETGGPKCGIVQLAAVGAKLDGTKIGDYNSYVKPPPQS